MPGKAVKNWSLYHKLREQGKDKTSAAKIANASMKSKPGISAEVDRISNEYDMKTGQRKRKKKS